MFQRQYVDYCNFDGEPLGPIFRRIMKHSCEDMSKSFENDANE